MKNFQFLYVYDDQIEDKKLLPNKKVIAIRISENCYVSTEAFQTEGYSASASLEFANVHVKELLSHEDIETIRENWSIFREMLKECSAINLYDTSNIWIAENGEYDHNNMEAISLSDGKCKFEGRQADKTAGFLLKLPLN